ncbi:XAC2610-related protein [Flavobacterium artemisiae]|uniref:XAC2610-related protein n=1 Tax=Flavobacterium artemisiae TaxID=2126556 RepID=A0ABW4HHY5_9FLAO
MRNYLFFIIFLSMISCIDKKTEIRSSETVKTDLTKKPLKKNSNPKTAESKEVYSYTETFADSTKIALPGKYKIEIEQTENDTLMTVYFKLFQKENNKWKLTQNYALSKESAIPLLTEIKDFNNDGLNDFTINYFAAARGANEIRKLFIFSKKENKFIEIKNSDDYPNLAYNEKLNCIDALSVYGGTTTTFLKLNKNTLTEFAKVDFDDGKVESYLIRNNVETKLHSETYKGSSDFMIRFINYDPIEE